jgi:hypothetical protein
VFPVNLIGLAVDALLGYLDTLYPDRLAVLDAKGAGVPGPVKNSTVVVASAAGILP